MKTAALWVSHAKDLEWFRASAKSFSRHARGFDFAKVVVPNTDVAAFKAAADPHGIMVCGFGQHPSKGFLHHMIMKCRGDEHFPQADVVFHLDSDGVFAFPFHTRDYLPDGKALLRFRDWSLVVRPETLKWKAASEAAVGGPALRETMAGWPLCHIREVYPKVRQEVERIHRCSFDDYVFQQQNSFPQTFCEFETLGVIAHRFFQERYSWRNTQTQGHPPVQYVSSWSHGGFHLPHEYPSEVGGKQTPHQLFQRLGLL